jgi:iron complex outermembrane receptor protein
MGNHKLRLAIRAVLGGGSLVASLGAANAQTAPTTAAVTAPNDQLQEVVVTGSRISVPNQVSISPVTFVSALDVQQSGVTRVEDLLNSLPQVFANQGSNISNGSTGAATVNLRGLNDKRTLVLVNGFRLGPGDPADPAADINMIPVELIDSIEILTGGASSVYGADAVAGVVNFKVNDHFEGVKLVADAGIYQHRNDNPDGVQQAITGSGFQEAPSSVWTGDQKSLALIAGINSADDKGNATVYATYRNIGSVLQSKYDYSACTLGSGFIGGPSANGGKFNCAGSSTSYPGRFGLTAINGVPASGPTNTIGPNGTLVPFTAADEYNYGALNYFQRPDERYSAGAFAHYEINEHATVYTNFMFMDDKSVSQIAPSGIFVDTRTFNCSNPFLSTDELNAWCAGNTANTTTLLIGRRNVEGGPRQQIQEHEDFHEVLGVKGKISDAWEYDTSFQYSSVNAPIINANFFDKSKEANALNVIGTAANPVCVVGPPCVPYNIFNLATPPSQAALEYLESPATNQGSIHETIVNANLTGDLAKYGVQSPLASSGLKINLGGEYRDNTVAQLTDAFEQSNNVDGAGGPAPSVVGGVISREGFLEARMPLIEDKPLAQSLNVETGYRYSSYNLGFSTNTYKFGVDWAPVQDVRLRGSFARAVRAPNVVELFTPSSISLDGTYNTDPCAGAHPVASQAACARTGVTAAEYGNIQVNSAAQYNGYSGGNPSLKAETALTTSFGIGWTPSFVPGFRAQIDYYNIKIEGVIQALGGSNVLQQCLQNNVLCGNIHRDQFGSLWEINDGTLANSGYIIDPLVNNGSLQERGVDLDLSYAFDIGSLGKVRTALVGTYINSYEVEPIANDPSSAYQCVGYYGSTCSSATTGAGLPVFRWRHTLRTTWSTPWSGLDVSLAWRYFSGAKTEQFSGNPNIGAIGGTIANGAISNTDAFISSVSYLDMTAAVKLADKVTLRLGVNNVFDKDPPIIGASTLPGPPSGSGNTFPQAYDALGRFFFGQIIAQF